MQRAVVGWIAVDSNEFENGLLLSLILCISKCVKRHAGVRMMALANRLVLIYNLAIALYWLCMGATENV